jgi:hypothetical protein
MRRTLRLRSQSAVFALSAFAALVATAGACYSGGPQGAAKPVDADGGLPFQADPPSVYVAKVKNVLTGLGPTDAEVQMVAADPTKLASLIDVWMTSPQFAAAYQAKMLVFFELAFQQTQISTTDFTQMIPQGNGIGNSPLVPLLMQNVKESFARTMLAHTSQGDPLTAALTTDALMMTPPLMELYAFLDANQINDDESATDHFKAANLGKTITLEASAGVIPFADSINPASPNYLHFYYPDVASSKSIYPDCLVDPRAYPATAHALHLLLYGSMENYRSPAGSPCGTYAGRAADAQFTTADFSAWKMVKIRQPNAGEAATSFYDVAALRALDHLVLATPRVGFFSTPAFFANWQTNTSNQMRVTINQTLIVTTGMSVDGTDGTTSGPNPPGIDSAHAAAGSACFGCHQTLDPSRAILQSTYSNGYGAQSNPTLQRQKGLFAFQGVVQPVSTVTELASVLAGHPAFAQAWAEKLCYYVNSQPCAVDDPEFQRIVGDFKASKYSWSTLLRELLSSPITTNATQSRTAAEEGELVPVSRRDHLCAALNNRLGLTDVCGLDVVSAKGKVSDIVAIASGLPSDGYGRGAPIPILPNAPTLFFRAGVENICEGVAQSIVDVAAGAQIAGAKQYASAQPDRAIASFVQDLMGLPPSDARNPAMVTLLTKHFGDARAQGASGTDALKSTFVVACLSPSVTGLGM